MTIHIEALEFEVIIGILDFERERTQRVIVDLEALYDYRENQFINYADITQDIHEALKEKKYALLEEALLGLKALLHQNYPQIKKLKIKITKPDILIHCHVALSDSWEF